MDENRGYLLRKAREIDKAWKESTDAYASRHERDDLGRKLGGHHPDDGDFISST